MTELPFFKKKKKKVYEYFCSFIFWEMHEKIGTTLKYFC